jgi:hypothetical protein
MYRPKGLVTLAAFGLMVLLTFVEGSRPPRLPRIQAPLIEAHAAGATKKGPASGPLLRL